MKALQEKYSGGLRPASQKLLPYLPKNLRFSLPYLWPDQKFDTLFVTVTAGTVALTADKLAQLIEHRTAVRKVADLNLGRTNTQGL